MDSHPKISVVIPCRNMGAYVGAAIESVFQQSLPVHEVIVVDDGSEDDTLAVLARFGARVTVIKGLAQGSAVARNLGILAAGGDYIAFLDADDLWLPGKLEKQIPRLTAECGFVFTDFYRDEHPHAPGKPKLLGYEHVAEGRVFASLLRENFISTPSVLVRKDLLAYAGLFKAKLIGGQDFDLWLRLARQTQFAWVREPLVFMRNHPGNITATRAYPYHVARVWEEVLREHGAQMPAERAYMQLRCGMSLYDAGRHAMRHAEQNIARDHFRRALQVGYARPSTSLWYLLAQLPAQWFESARGVKRLLAGSAGRSGPSAEKRA